MLRILPGRDRAVHTHRMVDSLKKWLKIAFVALLIWSAVQFALVFINRLQLANIMDGETMDARRQNYDEKTLLGEITNRAKSTISVPVDDIEFEVSIPDDPREGTYSVNARYTDWVNLFVYQHPMDIDITANAEPPMR